MKILIAGAGGQLGRCLVTALKDHHLVSLDRNALDITRLDRVREAFACHRPHTVINASAFNDVDGAETRSAEAFATNALGPRNLALAAAALGIPVMHVSTDYVFDGEAKRPYHEFDRPNPLSIYGSSKLAGEEMVRSLNHRYYIIRTAWLFWESGKGFLRQISQRLATIAPEPLHIADDQFGSPTYVPHLAQAIAALVTSEAFGTYHLAGSGGTSRWDLVAELYRKLRIDGLPERVSYASFGAAARRPAFSVLSTAQDPHVELPPWQEGVAEFVRGLGK